MKKLTTPAVSTAATTTFAVSSDIAYQDILSTSQIEKMNDKIRLRLGPITATGTFMSNYCLPAGYKVDAVVLDVKALGGTSSGSTLSIGTTTASYTTIINAYRWDTASIAAVGLIDISTSIVTLNPTAADRGMAVVVVDTATGTPNLYVNVSLSKVVTI